MHDLSAPTRRRLVALGAVRFRSSSRSAGDLERGGDAQSSGDVPPLRAQYGSGSPQLSGEADDDNDTFDTGGVELTPNMHQQRSGVRGWEGLDQGGDPALAVVQRQGSAVRFVSHVRSESGSQYPLH